MRRKAVPVKEAAVAMIAAGRQEDADLSKERSSTGLHGPSPLQLHVDASTRLSPRTERTAEQGDADDVAQTKRRQPLGLLPAAAIGSLIGVASAMLYLWCMERQRQNDLAWEYYRTH